MIHLDAALLGRCSHLWIELSLSEMSRHDCRSRFCRNQQSYNLPSAPFLGLLTINRIDTFSHLYSSTLPSTLDPSYRVFLQYLELGTTLDSLSDVGMVADGQIYSASATIPFIPHTISTELHQYQFFCLVPRNHSLCNLFHTLWSDSGIGDMARDIIYIAYLVNSSFRILDK